MSDPNLPDAPATPVVPKRRRRGLKWLLIVAASIAALVVFAPTLICVPAVRDVVLRRAVPAEAGHVELSGLSIGWLSPAKIRGLKYRSASLAIEAERVTCERTLLDLAKNWSDLGRIEIVAPIVVLDQSPQSESSELPNQSPKAQPKADGNTAPADTAAIRTVNADITVTNGKVTVLGAAGKPRWVVQNVQCKVSAPAGGDLATLEARADAVNGRTTTPVTATAKLKWPLQSFPQDLFEAQVDCDAVDLAMINATLATAAAAGPEFSGVANVRVRVESAGGGAITFRANAGVKDFSFVDPSDEFELHEPNLSIAAMGTLGRDTLRVETVQLVAQGMAFDASGEARWPVHSFATDLVEGRVSFAGIPLKLVNPFLARDDDAGPAGTPSGRELGGVASGIAELRPGAKGAISATAKIDVANFVFVDRSNNVEMREPKLVIRAAGAAADDTVQLQTLRLDAGRTVLEANAVARWPIQNAAADLVEGHVKFAGIDLALMNAFFASAEAAPGAAKALELGGVVQGTADIRPADGKIATRANATVSGFSFVDAAHEFQFREPKMTVTADASIDGETVHVNSLRVQSASLNVDGAGQITERATAVNADLSGSFECDWRSLQSHMSPVLPKGMTLAGKDRRPWSLRGPVKGRGGAAVIELIQADLGTRFEFLEFFGLELAPVEFAAKLESGALRVQPIKTTLERGQVAIQPTVTFEKAGPVATLAGGRLLDHMVVDKTLCDRVLRFVNPLVTGRGDLTGELSLDVTRFELPLGSDGLERAFIVGTLTLDDAEFRPDNVLAQILSATGVRVPPTIRASQSIAVRMENGRIHHNGLKLPVGDDYVVLDGWVGLDHRLNIIADVPLSAKLGGGSERVQRLVRGQRIQVPISGTIERIRFDERAIAASVQKMIQTGLRESLTGDDLLNGLIKSPKKK